MIDEDKKKVGIDEEKIKELVVNPDKYVNDNNLLSGNTLSCGCKRISRGENKIKDDINPEEAVAISENLIKNKGFENVVIMVNSGNVNVVVKYPKLSKEQVSQIQNIIEREFNVNANDVNISVK